jgi:predicted RNase H-like HicB family nuclease
MKRYVVVIEFGKRNHSAYVPDLPGCVSTGKTLAEVRRNIREAIAFHIDGMREDGETVPEPTCTCATVEVEVPPARGRSRSRRRTRQPA